MTSLKEASIQPVNAITSKINELRPWFQNLHLPDGSQTAPDHVLGDFPSFKWKEISNLLPDDLSGATALDIGCNAGFYSVELARRGAKVIGIDVNDHYLAQARWAAEVCDVDKAYDVCWIGNWGDEERSEEIRTFLIQSARSLKDLKFVVYGVRYPDEAIRDLQEAGIQFREWLPNFEVPEVLAQAKMTMHIPRRYYRENLAGIPTIRPFEALACSTPLISAPWDDSEELFRTGLDYLQADNTLTMQAAIEMLYENADVHSQISQKGLQTIRETHVRSPLA